MDDFNFEGVRDLRNDPGTGAWGMWGGHYEQAMTDQGFDPPFDRSPFPAPPGWHGGEVQQTGGMVMVRLWYTLPEGIHRGYSSRPGRRKEYEVAYGSQPGVSVQEYAWDDELGSYIHSDVIDSKRASGSHSKRRAAEKLMERHHNLTG